MTPTVSVWPPAALRTRSRLFEALGLAFGAAFRAVHEPAAAGAGPLVLFGAGTDMGQALADGSAPAPAGAAERAAPVLGKAPAGAPLLAAAAERAAPVLAYAADRPPAGGEPTVIDLARTSELDARLRGRSLFEESAPVAGLAVREGDRVLAHAGRACLWLRRSPAPGMLDVAAVAPPELGRGETLRERLRAGRFVELLPLVALLRQVTEAWDGPPPRAAFVLDDPNLHALSYGHVDYRALVRSAAEHGHHTALATVPLDRWLASGRAARLLREHRAELSLAIHGNDHVQRELDAVGPAAIALVAQALRRVSVLERRTRVPVCRVMVPPHGRCSAATMEALARLGFEAYCGSHSRMGAPEATSPLKGWWPADRSAGGMPVLRRLELPQPRDDLAFRAYLDQPLILYGHHGDLARGLEHLERAAADVASYGRVRWGPLSALAAMGVATRREGRVLRVRLFARRAVVEVPAGVDELRVELPPGTDDAGEERVSATGWSAAEGPWAASRAGRAGQPGAPALVRGAAAEPATAALRLQRLDALDPAGLAVPPPRAWPMARRLLAEGRDRLAPTAARLRRTP